MSTFNPQAEVPPVPSSFRTGDLSASTVDLYGYNLPVGILKDGNLHRKFAFKPFRVEQEREIAELRKKRKRATTGDTVLDVLATMLTRLGPYEEFGALAHEQKLITLSNMWMGDINYMYLVLRIEALGADYKLKLQCPSCEHNFKWSADLNQTDVSISDKPTDVFVQHTLRDGVVLPNGETEKTLVLQPPRWHVMLLDGKKKMNIADVKVRIALSSICQIGDGKFPVIDSLFESMTKYDLEKLTGRVDDVSPGPELSLELTCPACDFEIVQALDWNYDFFFGSPSL